MPDTKRRAYFAFNTKADRREDQMFSPSALQDFNELRFDYHKINSFMDRVIGDLDRRGEDARQAESDYWAIDDA